MKRLRSYAIAATLTLIIAAIAILSTPTSTSSQGASYTGTPIALTRGGFPASGATVTVCLGAVTVTTTASPPCSPYASIYSDATLMTAIAQPGFVTDGLGNFPFYVASGNVYTIVLTGSGLTAYSTTWAAPVNANGTNTFALLQTFDGGIRVKEITAPSGAAGYEVLYGNAATHRLVVKLNNAAEDAIVTDAGAATLVGKTLTSPIINGTPTGTGIPTMTLKSGSAAGDYTNATGVSTVIDSTNLSYTVTVATGWKMFIVCNAQLTASVNGNAVQLQLAKDGTSIDTKQANIPTAGQLYTETVQYLFTGDGASHTWALYSNGAATITISNATAAFAPKMVFTMTPSN